MKTQSKKAFALVVALMVFYCCTSSAQELKFFDPNVKEVEKTTQNPLLSYNIGDEKDLYLQLNTKRSLLDELQALAPDMGKMEVTLHGNYQFSFFIDGKLIYKENLGPGAILLKDKLINKPLNTVLISWTRSGLWSIGMWERFMMNGGLELLDKQPKNLTVELRAYMDNKGITYSDLLAKGSLNITRVPPVIDQAKMVPQVILPGSGWDLSKDTYNTERITALNTRIADQTFRMINGIVVIKDGKLLLEEYFNKETRETLHDPRSVTKSVTGTLVGLAINDGYLKSEDQELSSFYKLKNFKNYSPVKASVKISDLLTMSSAFDGNDDIDVSPGNEENMYPTPDYIKFVLDLPMDPKKTNGKQWAYFTAGTVLLGDILDKSIPGGLEQYAQQKLFDPLGIEAVEWARTPSNKPFGGGGLKMRALDFAKYGQVYKDNGLWKGKRVLPEEWVAKTFRHLQNLPANNRGFYGYLFWNKIYTVNGKEYEVYCGQGNGGNKIYVFKDQPLVIVVTASAYGRAFAHPQVDKIMEQYLLPAVLQSQ